MNNRAPYYSEPGIELYHGDCRDILPQLPIYDGVVTDPPYGIDYQSARRTGCQRKAKIDGDKDFPLWLFDLFHPTVAMFVCCRWDMLKVLPSPKSFIVWDKENHSMGDLNHEFGRQWEGIAFYPGVEHRFIHRPKDVIRVPRISQDKLIHPCEKPSSLFRPLIAAHPGELWLDPFCGVGSSLVACKQEGRKVIGIDTEERWLEIAVKRLSQTVMYLPSREEQITQDSQGELFDSKGVNHA